MSTKCTIHYGDRNGIAFHLYADCFDEDSVYLCLRGAVSFTATDGSVEVRIPGGLWNELRKHGYEERAQPEQERPR